MSLVLLVKRVRLIPFPTVSLSLASPDLSLQQRAALTPDNANRAASEAARRTLCLPVVPVGVCACVGVGRSLQWGARVLGRLLSLGGARVQEGRGFVGVEGPVVVWAGGAGLPVLRHPPEVLEGAVTPLVVVGTEVIRASSFGVWMSVVIGSVAPVVPVVAVLLVRPFSRRVIVAVTARAAVRV